MEVEQVWFAGAHFQSRRGYKESAFGHGASWMISRVAGSRLEFDDDYIHKSISGRARLLALPRQSRRLITHLALPSRDSPHPQALLPGAERLITRQRWQLEWKQRHVKSALVDSNENTLR